MSLTISKLYSTPLAVAANCSGRKYLEDTEKSISHFSANEQNLPSTDKDRTSDVLSTLRILVEQGASDPIATDSYGYTVLHLHTGTLEQFKYLLDQDHFQVDLMMCNHDGYTVSELHAASCWSESPDLTWLAWQRESLCKQRRLCSSEDSFHHGKLLHETALRLTEHFDREESAESSFLLIRQLIESGTDPHAKLDWWGDLTPLAQIPNVFGSWNGNPDEVRKLKEARNIRLAFTLRKWLKTLRDAGVEIKTYMAEEEKQALRRKEEGGWEICWWDHSKEFRVEWEFHYRERAEDCSITSSYEIRQKNVSKDDDDDDDDGDDGGVIENIPGAWIESSISQWDSKNDDDGEVTENIPEALIESLKVSRKHVSRKHFLWKNVGKALRPRLR